MIRRRNFFLIYGLLLATGGWLQLQRDEAVPLGRSLSVFPRQQAGWSMVGESSFSPNVLAILQANDYLYRFYAGPDQKPVGVYIGYHDGSNRAGGIHSPKHCLPGSGWQQVYSRRTRLALSAGELPVVQAVYQKDGHKDLFLYWFQVRGQRLNSEYGVKLAELTGSLVFGRRDSAFVRISLPLGEDEEAAVAAATSFVRDFLPLIDEFLPRP